MSIITYPAGLQLVSQSWGQRRFDQTFQSGDTGASQTRLLGPPRWTAGFNASPAIPADLSAKWRTLVLQLRGRLNQLAVYDISRPLPRGTARGLIYVHANAPAGATAIILNGQAANVGRTLLAGDWIGVSQDGSRRQLVQIVADDTFHSDGLCAFVFEPALRWAVAGGSVAVIDRPTCLMRQTTDDSQWQTTAGRLQGGFSLDLMESWE